MNGLAGRPVAEGTDLIAGGLKHVTNHWVYPTRERGGEGGIRTHGGLLTHAGFQDRCFQPLSHLSVAPSIGKGELERPWPGTFLLLQGSLLRRIQAS